MGSVPLSEDTLPADTEVLSVSQVSSRMGFSNSKVLNLITDERLLAVRRDGQVAIPALFFDGPEITKHLVGLIKVLFDGGFSRDEAMKWLFEVQDDLGICPAEALHGHQAREMVRRAQAQAF
ncbi:Rv2175c family DNA-binding protein [Williamsia limnetica]|uniref:Rv2175c family DNA-binding protein n=1 Tax=Williamsia limnetica TaxID=882452 RepID=UPI000D7CC77A|nr:Rv2175c family DNA-binding protein [Williamsia limnetica]